MSHSEHRVRTKGRADGVYPTVFSVDSHAFQPPPLPPKPSRAQSHTGLAQRLLFLLVSLALCGLVVEAFFIYCLHQSEHKTDTATFSKQTADEDVWTPNRLLLSKPVAQLTGGSDVYHGEQVMGWSEVAHPLLHEIDYIDQNLVIQKEGFYFIFSKVFFHDIHGPFYHSVQKHTARYSERNITLLQSRNYSPSSSKPGSINSFLGGVFHLERGDALYVNVTNTRKLVNYKALDNMFGAFML